MRVSTVLFVLLLAKVTVVGAQEYQVPVAGEYWSSPNDRPEGPASQGAMDWPWLGFFPLSITNPTGCTTDGQYFYIPDWVGGSPSTISKVDPATGMTVSTIPAPSSWPGGITWDGSYLWVQDYIGGSHLFKIDPATGSIITSFPVTYSSYWAGVAWDGQYLYYGTNTGGPGTHYIYKVDPTTAGVVSIIQVPSQDISGLEYYDGHLYYSDSQTYMLYKITMDGMIVETSPAYVSAWLAGVTIYGGDLWNVEYTGSDLHQYDLVATNMYVDLTYVSGSPVPSGGGNLYFNVFVENQGSSPLTFDAWLDVQYESGNPTTLAQRNLANFMPGWTINRPSFWVSIPGTWSGGNFVMTGRVGIHPNDIWAEDGFEFQKLGAADKAGFQPWLLDNMQNPFERIKQSNTVSKAGSSQLFCHHNPFNPTTILAYELMNAGEVQLAVYDIQGREVARLMDGYQPAGRLQVEFNGEALASGVYIANLSTSQGHSTRKLLLIK